MRIVDYKKIYPIAKNTVRSEKARAAVLAFWLSYFSLIAYIQAAQRVFATWNKWHLQHLENQAPSPLQFRVLSFAIPELLIRTFHVSVVQAYLLERFVFLFLIGCFLFPFVRQWFTVERSVLIVIVFFSFYNLTARPHIQPSEEPNIFFFLMAFMLIQRGQYGWLLLVCALGATTKTTIVFIIPIYLLHQVLSVGRLNWMDLYRTVLLTIIVASVLASIMSYYGTDRPYLAGLWQYEYNFEQLKTGVWPAYNFLFVSLIPMALIFLSWSRQPPIIKAVALVILPFTAGHFLISRVEEFRTFMPLALTTLPGSFLYICSRNWLTANRQSIADRCVGSK